MASEIMDDIAKKLLIPCTTRWNSFYDTLARISAIPMVELNTISSKLQLKCISEREHQCLREYCTVMKPLTVALELKDGLQILVGLPDAIVQVRTIILF